VIIALPIGNQPEYIEAALTAGKHVLAEKPIAPDVAAAKKLIDFWKKTKESNGAEFAVAENYRFVPGFDYAAEKARDLGKVTHFNVRVLTLMDDQNKFFKTSWRQTPDFQGGFALDGGVHFSAGARHFLRGEDAAASVHAFSAQIQPHLPPLDTIHAIIQLKSGAKGVYQQSSGSNLKAFEWSIAFEKGSVVAEPKKVVVAGADGEVIETKEFERTSGVSEEVAAWAESLQKGVADKRQSPEEALADLEFLEKIFRSGEQDGARQTYELQL
jgi:predicted dehydrogenase